MRRIVQLPLLQFLAFPMLALIVSPFALAQYAPPSNDQNILYGVKKNPMPQTVIIEQGPANPGIPTSGTQQMQQLQQNQARQRGYAPAGPTIYYRDPKDKGLTVITGPNGTTVCRDIHGRTVVCN